MEQKHSEAFSGKMRAWPLMVFALLSACTLTPSGSTLNCAFKGHQPLETKPQRARAFREIARHHPNDPNRFGPAPAQQLYSQQRWDTGNEFWFSDQEGAIVLYSNTSDFYVYYWHFEPGSRPTLKDHALVDCRN